MFILDVITLTAAGLLAGNELAIAAFVHPVLYRLPDGIHLAAATALARVLGRVMPFWYALVVVLTVCLALLDHHSTGIWPRFVWFSAGIWGLSIVYTITSLVPINNQIASWAEETKPENWKSLRSRWDHLHRWRVLLLVVAFALLVTGLLTGSRH